VQIRIQLCFAGKAKWDFTTNIFTDIFTESIRRINPDIEDGDIKRTYENICLALDNEDLGEAFSKYAEYNFGSGV